MRRRLLLLVIPLTAALVVVVAAAGVGESAQPGTERAAREDAQRRLDAFAPPPGAAEVHSLPGGLRFDGPGTEIDSPNFLYVGRLWTDPEPVAAAREWLRAAAPPGSRLVGTSYSGGRDESSIWTYDYRYPDLKGVSEERSVNVSVTAYGSGSALRGDAFGVWVRPRPATERIPAGVRAIAVERERLIGGYEPRPSGIVERGLIRPRPEVGAIVASVDGFERVQAGEVLCPLEKPANVIRLLFERRVGGPPVATASMDWPLGSCDSLSLEVEGKPQPPLAEGWILHRQLLRVLARLDPPAG